MPGLPHWQNSRAAVNYWEPIFQNQFEVIITPPASVTQNVDLLVEHVLTVQGIPEITPGGVVEQKYKFATRSYSAALPTSTTADLDIKFTVNLNDDNNMYIYNTLRQWADITFDPMTGGQGLKKDYAGEMTIVMFNKAQNIFREYRFISVIPRDGLTPISLDYNSNSLYEITVKFRSDTWRERRVGEVRI